MEAKIAEMKQKSGEGYDRISSYPCFRVMSILLLGAILILILIEQMLEQIVAEEEWALSNYSISRQARFYLP